MSNSATTLLVCLLLMVLVWVFGYFTASFMLWNLNPAEWPIDARIIMGIACSVLSVAVLFSGVHT